MSEKFVYSFHEGNGKMRELLGGKGANLAEMMNLGMPVPYGFTVTTEACNRYYEDGKKIGDDIVAEIMEHLAELEATAGKKFGSPANPLLVSVRSGARASMPGMMDTVLNLGLNDEVAVEFAKRYNVIVVLKGAYTVVAHPKGKATVNPTGNKGMAKAGSGDVLAGIIASLIAQGMSPFSAAVSGVYCHGYAGDLARDKYGSISMLSTDIIEMLPTAFKHIFL